MFSWGDWRWNGTAKGFMMNTEGQIMANSRGEVVTDMSNVDQYKYTIEMDNVQVGGSAQTTAALGVTFRPMKGLRLNGTSLRATMLTMILMRVRLPRKMLMWWKNLGRFLHGAHLM